MSLLSLAGVGFIGTVFWLVSPEAATALAGTQRQWSPLAIGLAVAAGQSLALGGLFFFGDQLRRRWRWFDAKCEKARTQSRLGREGYATSVVVAASVLGIPPISVTTTLVPGVAPRPLPLLPLILVLRFARFIVLAWGARASGWHLPW